VRLAQRKIVQANRQCQPPVHGGMRRTQMHCIEKLEGTRVCDGDRNGVPGGSCRSELEEERSGKRASSIVSSCLPVVQRAK